MSSTALRRVPPLGQQHRATRHQRQRDRHEQAGDVRHRRGHVAPVAKRVRHRAVRGASGTVSIARVLTTTPLAPEVVPDVKPTITGASGSIASCVNGVACCASSHDTPAGRLAAHHDPQARARPRPRAAAASSMSTWSWPRNSGGPITASGWTARMIVGQLVLAVDRAPPAPRSRPPPRCRAPRRVPPTSSAAASTTVSPGPMPCAASSPATRPAASASSAQVTSWRVVDHRRRSARTRSRSVRSSRGITIVGVEPGGAVAREQLAGDRRGRELQLHLADATPPR